MSALLIKGGRLIDPSTNLDAVGDLYLIGAPLLGAYTAYKSGHALNNQLACAVLKDEKAWEWVTFEGAEAAPAVTSMHALAA